jgi:predicted Zn-dependent protease
MSFLFRSRLSLTGLCATILLSLCSSQLFAQITPRQLLATSIEKYQPKYKHVIRAIELFKAGEIDSARNLLVTNRKKLPELSPPDVMMSLMYFSAKKRAEGEAALDRAILKHSSDPEAYILIAELALREHHTAVAQLAYQRGSEANNKYIGNKWRKKVLEIRIQAGMASMEESRDRYEESITHLKNWIKLDDKNPLAVGSLGRVYFLSGNHKAAREMFERLVKMEPNAPPVDIAMARLYSDSGMKDKALEHMQSAVKKSPDDTRIRQTIAEWTLTNGYIGVAKENVDAALKLNKKLIRSQVLRARIARLEGDTKTAEIILTEVILTQPNDFATSNELARALSLSTDKTKRQTALKYAFRNFQVTRRSKPTAKNEATMTYAWLLLKNDQVEKAEKALNTLSNNSTVSNENAYYAGEIYAARTRRTLAARTLKAALASDTPFPGRDNAAALLKEINGEIANN